MKHLSKTLAAAGLTALLSSAAFAAQVERVRGTIDKVEGGTLTIKTEDGKSETIDVGGAKFAWVVPSSLDQIKDGVFIGTATKGENPLTALEVVLFPESMRGTGEGHYGWDTITDQTGGTGSKVKSAMTNGTVKAETANAPKVKSAMTNGTVKADASAAGGARTLTVSYGKDGSKEIVVAAAAPRGAGGPGAHAMQAPGSKVFAVVAKDGAKAEGKLVAVGKDGLTPPM
jgi:hypothetical protein